MKLYINNASCVSPLEIVADEHTFELSPTLQQATDRLQIAPPPYKSLLSYNIIRRVAKFTKMGLYAAMQCVKEIEKTIDGVIVGTGIGGFLHSEKFISEMTERAETNLSPNAFFQSLHSSLSGNIAILTKCEGYNITYVNRGCSFESTLLDAALHLDESPASKILVGSADEITENYSDIANRTNYMGLQSKKAQPRPGEGAAFM
ncbi:MAG: beta-ketoacyl synthase chain length factor, partial [Bacteroidota bacterium]